MREYYIYTSLGQEGPFSFEELKDKKVERDTPVWFDGLQDWTPAEKIEDLKDFLKSVPPAFIKTTNSSPPPINAPLKKEPKVHFSEAKLAGASLMRRLRYGVLFLIVSGIMISVVYSYVNNLESERQLFQYQSAVASEESNKENVRNNITSYVKAELNNYEYNSLGGIHNLEVSVTNSSDYLIDKVKVKLFYYKPNGNVWDTRIIEFSLLDPNTTSTIKIPDTDRGVRVEQDIVSIKSASIGL